ncbi:MAG: hypothetical protein V1779_00760 [bacterium]
MRTTKNNSEILTDSDETFNNIQSYISAIQLFIGKENTALSNWENILIKKLNDGSGEAPASIIAEALNDPKPKYDYNFEEFLDFCKFNIEKPIISLKYLEEYIGKNHQDDIYNMFKNIELYKLTHHLEISKYNEGGYLIFKWSFIQDWSKEEIKMFKILKNKIMNNIAEDKLVDKKDLTDDERELLNIRKRMQSILKPYDIVELSKALILSKKFENTFIDVVHGLSLLFNTPVKNPNQLWQDIHAKWGLVDNPNFREEDLYKGKTYSKLLVTLQNEFDKGVDSEKNKIIKVKKKRKSNKPLINNQNSSLGK